MIDGQPRLSCLTMAQDAIGSKITTVEGLADGAHLAPISNALLNMAAPNAVFAHLDF